jgi:D-beta-D-heptose 7-phosphate kinase/D-beta-D-heptose 1-phosphate adenosyltransferase
MVLATLTMAIASGASWHQAALLANIAGGLEVEKFGIVPIRKDEIIDELILQDGHNRGKERQLPHLLKDIERRRRSKSPDGKSPTIVFTNGVFDILHAGHVKYMNFAKQQGDVLIVGVNSDDSVKRLKGPTRPVNTLADRMAVLAGLQSVDYVVSFSDDTPIDLIQAIQPDVLVKGEDYSGKEVVGREILEARGGKVILAPFLQGRSTTNTIAKIGKKD